MGSAKGRTRRTVGGETPFVPLQDYGVIGNNRTAALIDRGGSVDWACFPRFDSDPVFGALLDPVLGGAFRIWPVEGSGRGELRYELGTNVLRNDFPLPGGRRLTLVDFCPEVASDYIQMSEVHRRVTAEGGDVKVRVLFAPRFGRARLNPTFRVEGTGALASSPGGSASLSSNQDLRLESPLHAIVGDFHLTEGEEAWFVFSHGSEFVTPLESYRPALRLRQTLEYWREWNSRNRYHGRWHDALQRSALALKLLFYRPTGAMVAAPTTSLPEDLGGSRNWDYRFCWVRDTAWAIRSLFRLGYDEEAVRFIYWLLALLDLGSRDLQVLYTVDGEVPGPETRLSKLQGYRGSRPVRFGNAAASQFQHDTIGYVLEVADLLDLHGGVISVDLWRHLRHLVTRTSTEWKRPDHGIWEVRGGPRHYVYSKVMCWTSLERGIRLGKRLGLVAPYDAWEEARRAIELEVRARGLCRDGEGLAWYYGAKEPDASLLRLASLGFLGPDDPLMVTTTDRIERELVQGPLVRRYRLPDGLPGEEGTFLPCAFWRVEHLTLQGRLVEARRSLESLLRLVGPLGLLPEELGPEGTLLGNYPQALSHLSLILAATELDRALDAVGYTRRSVPPNGTRSEGGRP